MAVLTMVLDEKTEKELQRLQSMLCAKSTAEVVQKSLKLLSHAMQLPNDNIIQHPTSQTRKPKKVLH